MIAWARVRRWGPNAFRRERGRRHVAVDVETDLVIERPRDEVAAYAGDPTHAPEWYVNIKSIEWKTEPPLRVGSRLAFVARYLGRRIAYTYEVVSRRRRRACGCAIAASRAASAMRRANEKDLARLKRLVEGGRS